MSMRAPQIDRFLAEVERATGHNVKWDPIHRNRTYQPPVEWALDQLDHRRGIWRPDIGEPWHTATETIGEHPGSDDS